MYGSVVLLFTMLLQLACAQQLGNSSTSDSVANATRNTAGVLCSTTEYYCGGNLVMLGPLYQAIRQGSCDNTTEGLMVCGSEIIEEAMYTAVKGANCQQGCTDSAVAVGLADSYYWLVDDWTHCPASCDGGWQTRQVVCVNADTNRTVGIENCNPDDQPRSRRTCNITPCSLLQDGAANTPQFAPWGFCAASSDASPSCNSSGVTTRAAYCANSQGVLLRCAEVQPGALLRSCTGSTWCTQEGAMWVPGPWGPCNATCNGGVSKRPMRCINPANEQELPTEVCGALPDSLPSTRACGTAPCIGYTWRVEPFTSCSKTCGGGIRNRTVTCVDQFGVPAEGPGVCEGPAPASAVACNVQPCDLCSTTDCSKQGVCRNDVCSCTGGYRGLYCEIPPSCPGLLDKNGNCCPNGKIDVQGNCCTDGVLDYRGLCCSSGAVDACGQCDGAAKTVDVRLSCCASGVLDSAGYCCSSGSLDECGVCDGDSSSCALSLHINLQVPSVSTALQLGRDAMAQSLPGFLAGIVKLPAATLQLQDLVWAQALTSSAATDALLQATLQAQPGPGVSAAHAYRMLQLSLGSQPQPPLYLLSGIRNVTRLSVCGNGVCETGEWDPSAQGLGGCPQDCPFPLNLCPRDDQGALCGGRGRCMYSTGQCVCFVPYAGAACDQCAEGFLKDATGRSCARYVKADLPYLSDSSGASVWAVLGVGIALCVLGVALLCIALGIIVAQRRQIRQMSAAAAGADGAGVVRGGSFVMRGRRVSVRERRQRGVTGGQGSGMGGQGSGMGEATETSDASASSARALLYRHKSERPAGQHVFVTANASPLRSVTTAPPGPSPLPAQPPSGSPDSPRSSPLTSAASAPASDADSPRPLFTALGSRGNSMRQLFSRLRPDGDSVPSGSNSRTSSQKAVELPSARSDRAQQMDGT